MKTLSIPVKLGIVAGILFFLHALIPNSNAWPMIWQGIAAIFLVYWLKKSGKADHYKRVLKRLFQTGIISSAIFFICTVLVLYTISLPSMEAMSSFLGAEGAIAFDATLIFTLLAVAAIGIIEMLVVGSITYLIK